jgi:hypothetical protein
MQLVQVWIGYPTEFSLQTHFFKNELNFQNTSIKSYPPHWGLFNNTKSMPKISYNFSFDLKEFSLKVLVNIQY